MDKTETAEIVGNAMISRIREECTPDGFGRSELQDIRSRAENMAETEGLNRHWRWAYERIAQAADHIDAMWARRSE